MHDFDGLLISLPGNQPQNVVLDLNNKGVIKA